MKGPKNPIANLPKTETGAVKGGPGRPVGVKNRLTLMAVQDALAKLNFDPITEMVRLYPNLNQSDQLEALALLFRYTYRVPSAAEESASTPINISYKVVE